MIIRVDDNDFKRAFEDYDRVGKSRNFSYEGLEVLWGYVSEVLPEDWELDVIALCCDYAEYSVSDLWLDFEDRFQDLSRDDFESDDELNEAMLDVMREHGTVLVVDDETVIISVD